MYRINKISFKKMEQAKTSIPLMAIMMSLTALSIDIMLPALSFIGTEFALVDLNNSQLIISMFFLGMAIGQIFYGPMSDSIGRKPTVYIGFGVFIVATIICLFSQSLLPMLIGRVLQGIGLSANRIVCMAIIRDTYSGDHMARIMSFVMSIFILVPILAPAFGQAVLFFWHWRVIFWVLLLLASLTTLWFTLRQKETLAEANRLQFSLRKVFLVMKEISSHKLARNFTLIQGCLTGMFLSYLNSIQQILQEVYEVGDRFALWFGVLAVSVGVASVVNARLVLRYGMYKMVLVGLWITSVLAVLFVSYLLLINVEVPFWAFIAFLFIILFHAGILMGNLNAIIMEPLGHIAGTAASVVGAVSTFISIPIGFVVGQYYNQTILPLCIGITILFSFSLFIYINTVPRKGNSAVAM